MQQKSDERRHVKNQRYLISSDFSLLFTVTYDAVSAAIVKSELDAAGAMGTYSPARLPAWQNCFRQSNAAYRRIPTQLQSGGSFQLIKRFFN